MESPSSRGKPSLEIDFPQSRSGLRSRRSAPPLAQCSYRSERPSVRRTSHQRTARLAEALHRYGRWEESPPSSCSGQCENSARELARNAAGSTFDAITGRQLRSHRIPVAPLAEQERIVAAIEEHFSRLDAINASLDAAEARCHALIRSVIVGSIPAELPDDWQLKTVAEAGETGLGRQRSPKYHSGTNMKPYLRVANVFEDRIDMSSIMEMHFDEPDFEKYRLREGDILLNEGQSPELLGRPAIYRGEPPVVAFTNSLIRFVPGPGVTSEWALLVFRRHMHAKRFMRESRITTNIAHLALGRFRTVEFPVPPLKTQHELVAATRAALNSVDQAIGQIHRTRAKISALRHTTLEVAFSGQLVPHNPDDKPASVLLERIAATRTSEPKRQKSST